MSSTGDGNTSNSQTTAPVRSDVTPYAIAATIALILGIVTSIGVTYSAGTGPVFRMSTDETAEPLPDPYPIPAGQLEFHERAAITTYDDNGQTYARVGAIVVNTSSSMSASVTWDVEVQYPDGSRANIRPDDTIVVPPVPPNEKMGITAEILVGDESASLAEFYLAFPDWQTEDSPEFPGRLTIDDIEVHEHDRSGITVGFRVDVDHDRPIVRPTAVLIYRNANGDIIGASSPDILSIRTVLPPGTSYQEAFAPHDPPSGFDPESTEVYIHQNPAISLR